MPFITLIMFLLKLHQAIIRTRARDGQQQMFTFISTLKCSL